MSPITTKTRETFWRPVGLAVFVVARGFYWSIHRVLCPIVLIVLIGLWIRSYWKMDVCGGRISSNWEFNLLTRPGSLRLTYLAFPSMERGSSWTSGPQVVWPATINRGETTHVMLLGLEIRTYRRVEFQLGDTARSPGPGWSIQLPFWMLGVPLAAIAILSYRGWWLGRTIPGSCSKCGYDLRATPDRCPECGTLPRSLFLRSPAKKK